MNNPLVSIIVPVHNAENTIRETLTSILSQTYKNIEVIAVCNGCNDNSENIILNEFPLVKIIVEGNIGAAEARNIGIDNSKGSIIGFCDADDTWVEDKVIDAIICFNDNPKAGLCYSWSNFVNEKGDFLYAQKKIYYEGNVLEHLLIKNFLVCGSMCFVRKDIIQLVGKWDTQLVSTHDWDYWCRIAIVTDYCLVPKYQVQYRQHGKSLTANVELRKKYNLLALEKIFNLVPHDYLHLKDKSLATVYRHIAHLYFYRNKDVKSCLTNLYKAIRIYLFIVLSKEDLRLVKDIIIQSLKSKLRRCLVWQDLFSR